MNDQTKRTVFFYGLLATTATPLLVLPCLSVIHFPFNQSLLLGLAIFAGGVGHVGSTACVYADASIRRMMQPMKLRFYVLPMSCLLVTGIALIWGASLHLSKIIVAALFVIHLFWLHYHYQKQNYGLIAFIAASTGHRIPRSLSNLLLLPALAGVLAIMPTLVGAAMEDENLLSPYRSALFAAAVGAYLIGLVLVGITVATHRDSFAHARTMIFTALTFSFFLPAIILSDSEYAFWSYAIAHGFQYLLMVFTVAGGTKPSLSGIIAFIISVTFGGYFLHKLAGNQALFICGIILTWVHFVLDAKLWRMSEPGARKLLRERFHFLFP
ncbi:MAG: hypothetical protein CMJ80_16740 [Planctomycetaceae bacterium]|nr:hypothetical protein [Planctomycetaceae bacterium]